MGDEIEVVERVLQILQDGSYSSTYKFAVLVGLMDLSVEQTSSMGQPPGSVTTRQLAEKVVQLYWSQVREWSQPIPASQTPILRQNRGKRGVILREIAALREQATGKIAVGAGVTRVRTVLPVEVEAVTRTVEWKLIEMPLPKLQRVGGLDTGWLYSIGWSDSICPSRSSIRAYQDGQSTGFDNRILLRPEVALAFVRLHGLLRPFVEQRWAAEVARMNGLSENHLHGFLFGVNRTSLEPVRAALHDLQEGACFYCARPVAKKAWEVDHFIPWARHSDNGLDNLVVAHRKCNNNKRDFLAATAHVERWRTRRVDCERQLQEIGRTLHWEGGGTRTLGTARALYLRLPPDTLLWTSPGAFERADLPRLRQVLA